MKRRSLLLAITAAPILQPSQSFAADAIHVYKNPDCGCCNAWINHLKAAGFAVQVTDTADTSSVRKRFGMPERLAGCHTATLDGYVVEGHVPAADIKRLLAMKPQAIGIAVPGMPVGSPGMELGDRRELTKYFLSIAMDGRESSPAIPGRRLVSPRQERRDPTRRAIRGSRPVDRFHVDDATRRSSPMQKGSFRLNHFCCAHGPGAGKPIVTA